MAEIRQASHSSREATRFANTGVMLKRHLWIWPILAAIPLIGVGWLVSSIVERAVKNTLAENLQTILNADVKALRIWLTSQGQNVTTVASDKDLKRLGAELAELAGTTKTPQTVLLQSAQLQELRAELRPWMQEHGYGGFALVNSKGLFLAADRDDAIGREDLPIPEGLLDKAFSGKATVTRPFKSTLVITNDAGESRAGLPTMFAAAPVFDTDENVIAVLALRIQPEREFTEILSVARAGESGETYAFDKDGLLISASRFDDDLKQIGLLVDDENSLSILNIEIRDPGVDMTQGLRPAERRADQPLTLMAGDAIAGNSNENVDGYRDYRGVPVVGAWTWLPDYGFGVTSEVDVAEAYRPLYILRSVFWSLFALLLTGAVAIFVFSIVLARLNRSARLAAVKAQKLGQYTLDEKIGEGGMGVVYRGHHAMLQRPTAIKLLHAERTTDQAIARFEREVKLTSQLNHPNTIVIYDYGRTPEGVFYYAMEYLEGVNLNQLVEQEGPQPEGRVVHILAQVCASLSEAHNAELIHRDIKPANILLNQRGGVPDFVKLLDFGLVKSLDSQQQTQITTAGDVTGTPLYLSPEGFQNPQQVDLRTDLYAVGAVGYYLLTGKPPFDGTIIQIIRDHVEKAPLRPSERLGQRVAEDLEEILLRCLEKDQAARFQSAELLRTALLESSAASTWSEDDSKACWERNGQQNARDTATVHAATMVGNRDSSPDADAVP
jgi:hypothetical protein